MATLKNLIYATILIVLLNNTAYSDEKQYVMIFSAEWCGYCQQAQQDIEKENISEKISTKYKLIYIDFDTNKEVVKHYKVKQIPAFIILDKNNEESNRQVGYFGIRKFMKFLGLE